MRAAPRRSLAVPSIATWWCGEAAALENAESHRAGMVVKPAFPNPKIAGGRDCGDVSPLRGVILGGARHTLHVGVRVTPLDASEWETARRPATGA